MRKAWIPATVILAAGAFGQEPAVERSAIWSDTVKRGELPVMVRGLGVLAADKTAELKLPWDIIKQVQPGQAAKLVDTGQNVMNGKVARVAQTGVSIGQSPFRFCSLASKHDGQRRSARSGRICR